MKHSLSLTCFLLLTACGLCHEPIYYQYTPNNGLPSNEVYDAERGLNGYLWFGTDQGVARFDGKQFKSYPVHNRLGYNGVVKTLASPGGKIWVNNRGKNIYILQPNGTFIPHIYAEVVFSPPYK